MLSPLPPPLTAGDRVAVVAPSGRVDPTRLRAGVAVLERWGLEVRPGRHLLAVDPTTGYLAGSDTDRAADLQEAWTDPEITAVWSARGGFGAQRILDHLDWAALAQAGPRLYLGSSDATALHSALRSRLGLTTLFAPMPATATFLHSDATTARLRHTLLVDPAVEVEGEVLRPGRARGLLVGGNLTMLAAGVGAETVPAEGPALALLEDVDEHPYRIDRCLTQLLRTGWFEPVEAVVLGSFVGCGDPKAVRSLLLHRLAHLPGPVLATPDIGHGPVQRPVWLGAPAVVDGPDGGRPGRLSVAPVDVLA